MAMTPERWRRVKAVFRAALEAPDEQRATVLAEQCADDQELRGEIDRLLRHHEVSGSFLDSPMQSPTGKGHRSQAHADAMVGRRIGHFRIVRRIAVGGMGAVYEAEQENPRRTVAVKLLRAGGASASALRRFEYEAHVLGQLKHPGIARILQAGTFDAGGGAQPYFAMEYIDGPPITTYVQESMLPTEQRVALLARVCDAVQYAHQKGVIHRDLKPGNVLVETNAEETLSGSGVRSGIWQSSAQPKILDFGVARATDGDVQTMHTTAGELVGTISYMSPEQVAGDPEGIDTRSDVYALGVLGYELMAETLPYRLPRGTAPEAIRAIESEDPLPLSSVHRRFRGDLETILLKALEKDRARRYQSAAELASDLRSYLNNEPITARPPSAFYQLRKFTQRHRALVGGVAATFIALITGLVLFAWQARLASVAAGDAQHQQEQAAAVSTFLMTIFERIDPHNAGRDVDVLQLVDNAAEEISIIFQGQALSEAAVRNEVGTIYHNLAVYDRADSQFARALDLWQAHHGERHEDTLKAVNNLGLARLNRGELDDAVTLLSRAVTGRTRVLGRSHADTLVSTNNLAMAHQARGAVDIAEELLREALDTQRRALPENDEQTLTTMGNLANLLHGRGESEEAEAMLRQVVDGLRQMYSGGHDTTLMAIGHLARLLKDVERFDEAEALYREQLAGLDALFGFDHSHTVTACANLALVLEKREQHAESAAYYDRAADGFVEGLGRLQATTINLRYRAAHGFRRAGEFDAAAVAYAEVVACLHELHGDAHERTIRAINYWRRVLRDGGRLSETVPVSQRLIEARRDLLGPAHLDTIIAMDNHGGLLLKLDRYAEAASLYETLLPTLDEAFEADDWRRGISLGGYGQALNGLQRYDEAELALLRAHELLEQRLEDQDDRLITAVQRLVALYEAWGRDAEAATWRALLDATPDRR